MISQYKYNRIENNYEILRGEKVIIWCKSIKALNIYKVLRNYNIDVIGFTDSFVDNTRELFAGLPVYTFKQIQNMKGVAIYIATNTYQYQQEILEQTAKLGHAKVYAEGVVFGAGEFRIEHMKQIIKESGNIICYVRENFADEISKNIFDKLIEYRVTNNMSLIPEIYETNHLQYFPKDDWMEMKKNEIFVDAGAHDGATSWDFYKWTSGSYAKIYMMEPDPLMYEIMKEYVLLKNMKNVIPVKCGAYSFTGELGFIEDSATGSSRIAGTGKTIIPVTSIDDMLDGEKATFIKMDIEGAEMEALIGSKKTIEKYNPKLAISIYHKEDDLWKIPYYILSNYPNYKIYIRHYALTTNETVMYAVL